MNTSKTAQLSLTPTNNVNINYKTYICEDHSEKLQNSSGGTQRDTCARILVKINAKTVGKKEGGHMCQDRGENQ